jgi:glucans biosynthesis protein
MCARAIISNRSASGAWGRPTGLFRPDALTAFFLSMLFVAALSEAIFHGPVAAGDNPFTFQDVIIQAEASSKSPFKSPEGEVPEALLKINYDGWRDIRFKPSQAL